MVTQATSHAPSSLHAVPQGDQAQSDWNTRLVAMLSELQKQVADLQSRIATQANNGVTNNSVTFGTGHTMTVVDGIVTGYT